MSASLRRQLDAIAAKIEPDAATATEYIGRRDYRLFGGRFSYSYLHPSVSLDEFAAMLPTLDTFRSHIDPLFLAGGRYDTPRAQFVTLMAENGDTFRFAVDDIPAEIIRAHEADAALWAWLRDVETRIVAAIIAASDEPAPVDSHIPRSQWPTFRGLGVVPETGNVCTLYDRVGAHRPVADFELVDEAAEAGAPITLCVRSLDFRRTSRGDAYYPAFLRTTDDLVRAYDIVDLPAQPGGV